MSEKKLFTMVMMAGVLILCGCQSFNSPEVSSCKSTSFSEVSKKLDADGSFYLYLDTDGINKKMATGITVLKEALNTQPNIKEEDRRKINKAAELAVEIINRSGLKYFTGLGMSSVQFTEELYHNKVFLYRAAKDNTNKGKLWSILGEKPHKLETLEMLPEDTVMAVFADINSNHIRDAVNKAVTTLNLPEASSGLDKFKDDFERKAGVKIGKFGDSFNNHAGFFLCLDPQKTNFIPVGFTMVKIPAPSLAIVLAVKDDFIFNYIEDKIKQLMPQIKSRKKDGVKLLNIPLPTFFLPVTILPTVAMKNGILVIGSNLKIVNSFFANDKKLKLITQQEFVKLSRYIPDQGNGFKYVSPRFSKMIGDIQSQISKSAGIPPSQLSALAQISAHEKFAFFGVYQSGDDGLYMKSNSTQDLSTLLAVHMTVVPTAIAAAAILPAINQARKKAREIRKTKRNKREKLEGNLKSFE